MSEKEKKGAAGAQVAPAMGPPGLINKEDIPQVLPILPLRNSVFFPGGVLPLANFGTVNFTGASANGSLLTSSTPHIDEIVMANGSTVKAQPSGISSGVFSDTWKHS